MKVSWKKAGSLFLRWKNDGTHLDVSSSLRLCPGNFEAIVLDVLDGNRLVTLRKLPIVSDSPDIPVKFLKAETFDLTGFKAGDKESFLKATLPWGIISFAVRT
jgi:hypothetical protein